MCHHIHCHHLIICECSCGTQKRKVFLLVSSEFLIQLFEKRFFSAHSPRLQFSSEGDEAEVSITPDRIKYWTRKTNKRASDAINKLRAPPPLGETKDIWFGVWPGWKTIHDACEKKSQLANCTCLRLAQLINSRFYCFFIGGDFA